MRAAWSLSEPELARELLELVASELDRTWPDAAGSMREGMTETLTLMRLGSRPARHGALLDEPSARHDPVY